MWQEFFGIRIDLMYYLFISKTKERRFLDSDACVS